MTGTPRWVDVAPVHAVRPGRARSFTASGCGLLVCNVDGELHAVANACTHDGGRLGAGRLRGAIVECPRHGACFDVRDGSVQKPPAVRPLAAYPVRVVDSRIQVGLPDPESSAGAGP